MIRLLSGLLAVVLSVVGAPVAHAAGWVTRTVVSSQPGCALAVTVTYRVDSRGVTLDRVLATGLNGASPNLVVATGGPRWAALRYIGPNGHGLVGDGVDYEWTYGTETNADGARVPIGASDSNPQGWPHHGYTSRSFEVRVTAPEMRYCGVVLQLPVGG